MLSFQRLSFNTMLLQQLQWILSLSSRMVNVATVCSVASIWSPWPAFQGHFHRIFHVNDSARIIARYHHNHLPYNNKKDPSKIAIDVFRTDILSNNLPSNGFCLSEEFQNKAKLLYEICKSK